MLYSHMCFKEMMPNWSLSNTRSIKIHNLDAPLIYGSFDSAVVGPFSGQKRGLDLDHVSHTDDTTPRTEI